VSGPHLTIFTGPMFGSKTSHLIAACYGFKTQGRVVAAFKPAIDVRYGDDDMIRAHNGHTLPAGRVEDGADLERAIAAANPDVIAVDEVFMIPGAADVLIRQFRKGISVVVASIQMSAALTPFEEMVQLLPWATEVTVCSARCAQCGDLAYFTAAKHAVESVVVVGGSDIYSPLCFSHFQELRDVRNS
jgi:thymidine kinase